MKELTADITARFLLAMDEIITSKICISQQVFAQSIGEHPQNISKMKKGTRAPTLAQCARVCQIYNYNANWLLMNIGTKKRDKRNEKPLERRITDLEIIVREINKKK